MTEQAVRRVSAEVAAPELIVPVDASTLHTKIMHEESSASGAVRARS